VSQVLDRGTEAVTRGAARCASHVLHRGAQAGAQTGAAASGEEHSADEQRSRVNITSFICTEAR
jgi:hypothetical protein